jgi:cytochrome o ubiquinol oxidase subunit 1
MPRNTPAGFAIGMLAFVLGFAAIWHIWWLAALGALGLLGTVIARSFNDEIEYVIPAAEVARIETERLRRMAEPPCRERARHTPSNLQPVLEV